MDFFEVFDQVVALLQRRGRVTYRALKLQFKLDDDSLDAVKDELIYSQQLARDEEGRVLVWQKEAMSAASGQSEIQGVERQGLHAYGVLQLVIALLQREGYDVFLVLEGTIGFDKKSPEDDDSDADHSGAAGKSFSDQDHAFLKALKITVKE